MTKDKISKKKLKVVSKYDTMQKKTFIPFMPRV